MATGGGPAPQGRGGLRGQVHGEREARHPEPDRVRGVERGGQARPGSQEPDDDRQQKAQRRGGGHPLRRRGGHDQEREDQQRAGDLGGFRDRGAEQDQERYGESPDRDAAGGGHVRVDGGEQQGPADGGEDRQ